MPATKMNITSEKKRNALPLRLGRVVATPGILDRYSYPQVLSLIQKHAAGDWGSVSNSDRTANDWALISGGRILSSYEGINDLTSKVWVITEADRSVTTVLLPSEY